MPDDSGSVPEVAPGLRAERPQRLPDVDSSGAEAVQFAMLLSAIRCLITYVLLPGAAAATGATASHDCVGTTSGTGSDCRYVTRIQIPSAPRAPPNAGMPLGRP